MTQEEIVKQVKAIIVDKLGVEESEVTETANFTNDLGADSLDTVELLMEFERRPNSPRNSSNQNGKQRPGGFPFGPIFISCRTSVPGNTERNLHLGPFLGIRGRRSDEDCIVEIVLVQNGLGCRGRRG